MVALNTQTHTKANGIQYHWIWAWVQKLNIAFQIWLTCVILQSFGNSSGKMCKHLRILEWLNEKYARHTHTWMKSYYITHTGPFSLSLFLFEIQTKLLIWTSKLFRCEFVYFRCWAPKRTFFWRRPKSNAYIIRALYGFHNLSFQMNKSIILHCESKSLKNVFNINE